MQAVAGSANVYNSNGTITSLGCNLSNDDGSGFLTQPTDRINTNPKLDPNGLQDNGGPTKTIALLPDSPAIDKGSTFGAGGTDQRGVLRPVDVPGDVNRDDGADIGAFEYQPRLRVSIESAPFFTTVTEGGTVSSAVFKVRLSAPAPQDMTVQFATRDETATAPADYTARSGTITFSKGQTVARISIRVKDDALNEKTETFQVVLSNPSHGILGLRRGTGTIKDNDPTSLSNG